MADLPRQRLPAARAPVDDRAARNALLGRLRSERSWPEIRDTLIAWCEHGFRLVDTAQALHIHRNTLVYRLGRISDLCGQDIREARTALTFYVACLLEQLDDMNQMSPEPA